MMMMMFGNDEGSESDDDEGPALPPSFFPLSVKSPHAPAISPPTRRREKARNPQRERDGNGNERDGSGRAERNVTRPDRESSDFGSAVGAGADTVSGRRDLQNGCQ